LCRTTWNAAQPCHDLFELLAVFATLDGFDGGPDELDPIALQYAAVVQRDRGVECCLTAEGGQQRIRTLFRDHHLDEVGGYRLDVGRVGEFGIRHDRRRVGVDQDHPEALVS